MSLGSYVHREASLAAAPDTAVSPGGGLAVETLLGLFRSAERYAPLGLFSPWAERLGTAWAPIAPSNHDVLLYPLTDDAIGYANTHSFGHELPWVGIFADKPRDHATVDAAFDRTRYDLSSTEAVYHPDSGLPTPRIHFLYTATLHPDVGGGRDSLQRVAESLGGRLVFPIQVPVEHPREPPALPFTVVLDAQLAQGRVKPRRGRATHGVGETAPGTGMTPALGLFWAATAATCGYVFLKTVFPSPRGRSPARRR